MPVKYRKWRALSWSHSRQRSFSVLCYLSHQLPLSMFRPWPINYHKKHQNHNQKWHETKLKTTLNEPNGEVREWQWSVTGSAKAACAGTRGGELELRERVKGVVVFAEFNGVSFTPATSPRSLFCGVELIESGHVSWCFCVGGGAWLCLMNDQAFRAFDTNESGPSSLGHDLFFFWWCWRLHLPRETILLWRGPHGRRRIKNFRFMLQTK